MRNNMDIEKREKLIFISFFTPDYAEDAVRLVASLLKLKLDHDVRCIKPQSDSCDSHVAWLAAVRYKPVFMKLLLEEHPECDAIVWVDADAIVNCFPSGLFYINSDLVDLAVHFKNELECLSGTVYIPNTDGGKQVLKLWVEAMDKKPGVWEQKVLGSIIERDDIRVHRLDTSLCKIFDLVEKTDINRTVVPVIEHFQASRRIRRKKRIKEAGKQGAKRVRTKAKNVPITRNGVRRIRRRRRRR